MCSTCSSMVSDLYYPKTYNSKLGKQNFSNAIETINYGSYKPKAFANGTINSRYSNMTDSEAQSECQAEYDADPVAFFNKYGNSGGDFSACIKKKKSLDTQSGVLTTLTSAGNFFNQLSGALHVFMGGGTIPTGQMPLPGTSPLPSAQPKALGAGAWIAIIVGLVGVATVVVVVAKKSNKGGGTK